MQSVPITTKTRGKRERNIPGVFSLDISTGRKEEK
jgi:hypothetical protein